MNQSGQASYYVQKGVSVSLDKFGKDLDHPFCAYISYKRENMKPKRKKIYVKGRVIVALDINVKMTREDKFFSSGQSSSH